MGDDELGCEEPATDDPATGDPATGDLRADQLGGDPVCWLERVCDRCGGLSDGPPGPRCDRCGAPTR